MPAVTRSIERSVQSSIPTATSHDHDLRGSFVANMRKLLAYFESAQGKENKIRICLEIYETTNKALPKLIEKYKYVESWYRFAATVFNKTTEFITDFEEGNWVGVDKNLVEKFNDEIYKARKFVATLIKNDWVLFPKIEEVIKAKKEIERLEKSRPRRNIPRIDYTGMDTIELVYEYDCITNIWFDETEEDDSDYEFEEDEDDEDEDDEDEDDEDEDDYHDKEQEEELFKKKMQHVTVRKQTSLLPLLLFTRHDDEEVMRKNMPNVTVRPKRKVPRVDYSGMDMTEEDEGSVYICETKWKDRVPTHRWVEYPVSQVNELGDEEWCEDY
jgi:hypothetical protein